MVRVRCCGCSLQTGSTAIALWIMFSSLVLLGLGIWGIENFSKNEDNIQLVYIVVTCISAASLSFAVLLLIGVVKRKPLLLKIWMVYQCLCVFLGCIESIMLIAWGAEASSVLRQVGGALLDVYFLMIVHGFYKELISGYQQIEPIIPSTPSNAYGAA